MKHSEREKKENTHIWEHISTCWTVVFICYLLCLSISFVCNRLVDDSRIYSDCPLVTSVTPPPLPRPPTPVPMLPVASFPINVHHGPPHASRRRCITNTVATGKHWTKQSPSSAPRGVLRGNINFSHILMVCRSPTLFSVAAKKESTYRLLQFFARLSLVSHSFSFPQVTIACLQQRYC